MARSPADPARKKPIRVVIVDDHAVVRQGTRDLLLAEPGIEVVGELDSGESLIGLLRLRQADVVLLDINLPGKNGLQLLEELRQEELCQTERRAEEPEPAFGGLKVILFTAHTDLQYIRKGIALRADGYLSKTVSGAELRQAIEAVLRPGHPPVYSVDVAGKIAATAANNLDPQLTARELEILLQVAQGLTNRDIAQALVLSVKTIDSHVAKLMKKLGVNNRSQLTAYAYEQGLL